MLKLPDSCDVEAYNTLIDRANHALKTKANPVTNKTILPPSGDMHDYYSIAPYWWPDPDKKDGLPWIRKDGQVNPMTRGDDTDYNRKAAFFNAVNNLSMAYYFSKDEKYASKILELIKVWFINEETKVNPNVNFGQGVPGLNDGKPSGIIEWTSVADLITAIQILDQNKLLSSEDKKVLHKWLSNYVNWLQTSDIGVADSNTNNNHANWYDYQVIGIHQYLGNTQEAKKVLEAAKTRRIAAQIQPDGSQPHELKRTKSINYSVMNLTAMLRVAELGKNQGVDLFHFETKDGRSLKKAILYFRPYLYGEKSWEYEQITSGGVEKAMEERMKPFVYTANTIFDESIIDTDKINYNEQQLSYMQILKYPLLKKNN